MPVSQYQPAVLDLLCTAREPRSTKELWEEITLGGLRKAPKGLPTTLVELASLMASMHASEVVAITEGDKWSPLPPKVKVERSLF
jgi:hypothetical protein